MTQDNNKEVIRYETMREALHLICNAAFGTILPNNFSIEDSESLRLLVKQHDIANLVGYAISKSNLSMDEETYTWFKKQYYHSVLRVERLETELQKIRLLFEKESVDFLPLKGSVIRRIYSEPWMRLSSDIDVLVKEKDLKKAISLLSDNLGYQTRAVGTHDVSLRSKNGNILELHFVLSSQDCEAKAMLDEVWERSHLVSNSNHEFMMDDDFCFFYHMFHTAKHFKLGGCGMRAILDTYMLNHKTVLNSKTIKEMLSKGGLSVFSEKIEQISEKWFSDNDFDSFNSVEEYIMTGGVFGKEQLVEAEQAKRGGRGRYILSRVFPPRSILMQSYPVLRIIPLLMPVCWMHRLLKSLFLGKTKRAQYELNISKVKKNKSIEIAKIFAELGL